MSIIRVGLSGKNYAEGYDAIFGKKKAGKTTPKATVKKKKSRKK